MTDTIYEFEVYCIDESTYISVWGTSPPTVCPHNNSHTLNYSLTHTLQKITQNQVIIKENNNVNFLSESVHITAPANTTTTINFKFPMPIVPLTCYATTGSAHIGDRASLFVAPIKPLGGLAAGVSPASTWVSQNYVAGDVVSYNSNFYTCIANTVANEAPLDAYQDIQSDYWTYGFRIPISTTLTGMSYCSVGYYIIIDDGINSDELNRILSVDTTNNYLYLETRPSNSYSLGTALYLRIYNIKDYEIGEPGRVVIGAGKIGGKGIPKYIPIYISYQNNSISEAKELVVGFEYLY